MRGNTLKQETAGSKLIERARARLAAQLPPDWRLTVAREARRTTRYVPDALFRVRAPDGTEAVLVVEAKSASTRGWERVVEQLAHVREVEEGEPLAIVDYAGPGFRRSCESRGINYMDLTGWTMLRTRRPAILLASQGANRDPIKRRATSIARLSGRGAGRVLRALTATMGAIGVRDLADVASVRPGTVSKVLKTLEREGVVSRTGAGTVESVRKRALVERWARDYDVLTTNTATWYVAPRGLQPVVAQLPANNAVVATGSLAMRAYLEATVAPVTALSQVALYASDVGSAARRLGLAPVDAAKANVLLLEPYDAILLVEARPSDAGRVVDPGQTAVDLYTGPGRGREEAEQLMNGLAKKDPAWA